jgi:tyrosyl-tRNA synthetase
MKIITTKEKISEILNRGVDESLDKISLIKKLESGEQLRIKFGIDPTSPNIHIGRSVPLLKLRDLQKLGHKIILIIGDFTGVIGDTSDKDSERPMLSDEIIKTNMEKYVEQAGKIINIDQCEIHYNSEWLKKLSYKEICEQTNIFSINNFIARENIKKRLDKGKRVSLREILYPIMQGYDSVAVKADVEIGGTDQRFNLLAGRDLQRFYNQLPQDIITNPLLEGLDGRKMSSSWDNVINLFDSPREMFGKVMSIKDELIIKYFWLVTRVNGKKIDEYEANISKGSNPKNIKLKLAYEIVKFYHSKENADKEETYFVNTFSKKIIPDDMPVIKLETGESLPAILIKENIISSMSEWRRLVESGAVKKEDGTKIKDIRFKPVNKTILKIGKKQFVKILT